MSDHRRYITNSAWMLIQAVIQRGAGLFSTLLLSRLISAGGLGAITAASNTAATSYSLMRLGADAGMHVMAAGHDPVKQPDQIESVLGNSFSVFLIISLVGTGAILLLSGPIAETLFADRSLQRFIAYGGCLLGAQIIAQFAYSAFAGLHDFRGYALVMGISGPTSAVMTVCGGYLFSAEGAAISLVAGQIITACVLLVVLRRRCSKHRIILRPRLSLEVITKIIALGFPFYLAGLLIPPTEFFIQSMMVKVGGISQLGQLRAIVALTSILAFIPSALAGPMISTLTRTFEQNRDQHLSATMLNLKVLWFFGLGGTVVLGLAWPLAINVLFGPSFQPAADHGHVAVFTIVFTLLNGVVWSALLSMKRMKLLLGLGMIQAAAFLITALVLVPAQPLLGYLWAQFASGSGALGLTLAWVIAARKLPPQTRRQLIWMTSAAATIFAIVTFANATQDYALVWKVGAGGVAAATLITISLTKVFDHGEVTAARNALKAFKR